MPEHFFHDTGRVHGIAIQTRGPQLHNTLCRLCRLHVAARHHTVPDCRRPQTLSRLHGPQYLVGLPGVLAIRPGIRSFHGFSVLRSRVADAGIHLSTGRAAQQKVGGVRRSFQSADLGFSRRRQLAGTGYLSGAVNGDVLLLCLYGRDQKRPAPPGVSVRRAGTGIRFSWAYRLDRTCECHWRLLLTEPAVAHVAAVFTALGGDSDCRGGVTGLGGLRARRASVPRRSAEHAGHRTLRFRPRATLLLLLLGRSADLRHHGVLRHQRHSQEVQTVLPFEPR